MRKKKITIYDLPVTNYAAEGMALARVDGKVIFVEGAVPGDVADVLIIKNKKDWAQGKVVKIKKLSKDRVEPFCMHFGVCGGCKWQMLPYQKQLEYKQQEAEQNLKRISKMELPVVLPIIGAAETIRYRNKLEFTFSNRRYLLQEEVENLPISNREDFGPALGYHVSKIFDKILDIQECYLMDNINNVIRNSVRSFATEQNFSYYDIKNHTGWLRNIIVRVTFTKEIMINIIIGYDDNNSVKKLANFLLQNIPGITTLLYTINTKWNDSIYDLVSHTYFGNGFIREKLGDFNFKISPKSFFQTNTRQAEKLYNIVKDFSNLSGSEIIYDLYCGTGTIGIFLSKQAKKVIGVDAVEEAINDARENALHNNIGHASFYWGDVIEVCSNNFFDEHGKADIIVTDPPRAGMHEKLIKKLLDIAAPKIIYVSCNVATQARDMNLLSEKYAVKKIQPVDMFPHTHHIECVGLLELK